MESQDSNNVAGEFQSPGGFVFGVQGFSWGEPKPKSITFFIDGTTRVSDQHGRPILRAMQDNKEVRLDGPHATVIAALAKERIDWTKLACAGWPQLPYAELMKLKSLPPTPLEELRKISDPAIRKDALRARRESDAVREKELAAVENE